jgi:hypothetical protein
MPPIRIQKAGSAERTPASYAWYSAMPPPSIAMSVALM